MHNHLNYIDVPSITKISEASSSNHFIATCHIYPGSPANARRRLHRYNIDTPEPTNNLAARTMTSSPLSQFTVLYFAAVSDRTGRDSERLPAPLPLAELFPALEWRYPGITEGLLASCLVTVNLEYVDVAAEGGMVIREGDEVAVIPPVSSG